MLCLGQRSFVTRSVILGTNSTNRLNICRCRFRINILKWDVEYFDLDFIEICSWGFRWQYFSLVWGNCTKQMKGRYSIKYEPLPTIPYGVGKNPNLFRQWSLIDIIMRNSYACWAINMYHQCKCNESDQNLSVHWRFNSSKSDENKVLVTYEVSP